MNWLVKIKPNHKTKKLDIQVRDTYSKKVITNSSLPIHTLDLFGQMKIQKLIGRLRKEL